MSEKLAPWTYRAYSNDTPNNAFGVFEPFVNLWRNKHGTSGALPSWSDFELMDFQPWWGQVSVLDIETAPVKARWRLWGTIITEWWGADYTGRALDEIEEIETTWVQAERPYFEHLLASGDIGFITGPLEPQNMDFVFVHGIDLPLQRDGQIAQYLSVYERRPRDDEFIPNSPSTFEI